MHRYFLTLVLLGACGGELDRAELLDRLRGIGSQAAPLVNIPSDEQNQNNSQVSFFLALPNNKQAVTIKPFVDPQPSPAYFYAPESSIVIDETSIKYIDYDGFRVLGFDARVQIPTAVELGKRETLYYGVSVATDDDIEHIVGRFAITNAATTLSTLSLNINAPSNQATQKKASKIAVSASVLNPNQERIKNAWFCTGGSIQNRRSLATTWTLPTTPGRYSLMLTARGLTSHSFAMQVISVTVE